MAKFTLPKAPEGYTLRLGGGVQTAYVALRKKTWYGSKLIIAFYLDRLNQWEVTVASEKCLEFNELRLALKASK